MDNRKKELLFFLSGPFLAYAAHILPKRPGILFSLFFIFLAAFLEKEAETWPVFYSWLYFYIFFA